MHSALPFRLQARTTASTRSSWCRSSRTRRSSRTSRHASRALLSVLFPDENRTLSRSLTNTADPHTPAVAPVPHCATHRQSLRSCVFVRAQASFRECMERCPEASCILVKRHGFYCWGPSWQQAKAMCAQTSKNSGEQPSTHSSC